MHYIYGATIGNSGGGTMNITIRYLTFNFLSNRSSKYTTIRDIMIDLSSAHGSIYINASGYITSAQVGYNAIRNGSLCTLHIHDSIIEPIFSYIDTSRNHVFGKTYGNIALSNLAQNEVTDTVITLCN